MKYIGFFMDTNILNHEEKNALLMDRMHGAELKHQHIKYFSLLYRASTDCYHGIHNDYVMTEQCKDKSNVVMMFHTNYNHIFAIHFTNPIKRYAKSNHLFESDVNNNNVDVFLMRSQFIYGNGQINQSLSDKKCPRIIRQIDLNKPLEVICLMQRDHPMVKLIHNIRLSSINGQQANVIHEFPRIMDFVGNELCGGDSFKTSNDNREAHTFVLHDVEVFQVL
eukprot:48851_1